jgi:N-acetyltransferase 10
VESTNPEFGKSIVRVNVYRTHRQTVQYIQPQHHAALAQAELLVIDEAAAIPLPIVRSMLGPYLVFLCSTVNGYEGTGRSLSLKLIQQLRAQGAQLTSGDATKTARTFREIVLHEPIRYAGGDPIERWLNDLLCLDAGERIPPSPSRLPHPDECELFYVERDTLFSGHKASEAFLQRLMALYVASHYRNTPNDLLLLADAPAHQVFVLLAPVDPDVAGLPDVLAVVQVALEGTISKKSATASLAAGQLPQGDLIPWTVGQQFQDAEFPSLSGARIVRIAAHPELMRAGYGSRAVSLLCKYYQGEITNLEEEEEGREEEAGGGNEKAKSSTGNQGVESNGMNAPLLSEHISPRSSLPPLLTALSDRKPEKLDYVGTSFGLTLSLYSFWRRNSFLPVYLRQTPSDITGEHTVIMLKCIAGEENSNSNSNAWLDEFVTDFRTRFVSLLPGSFRNFEPALALSILDPKVRYPDVQIETGGGGEVVRADGQVLGPFDMKRLKAYASNLVDHHMISDLVPPLARAYVSGAIPVTLSYSQVAILVCLGLQQREIADVETSLGLPSSQTLALFAKTIRRFYGHLRAKEEARVGRTLPQIERSKVEALEPHEVELDAELEEGAHAVSQAYMKEVLRAEDLEEFEIRGGDDEFAALGPVKSGGLVSIPSSVTSKGERKQKGLVGGEKKSGKQHKSPFPDKERRKKMKK